MARRRQLRFDSLWDAVVLGTVDDVRAVINEAGAVPEVREEDGDPTALMYAAARGRLDVVRVLVEVGADANAVADPAVGFADLPELPFLEDVPAVTALGYAAAYGRKDVFAVLTPVTAPDLRPDAVAIGQARRDYLAGLDDVARAAFVASCDTPQAKAKSKGALDREALLAERPGVARWIVRCALCQREGYKPALPDEIDRRGTAARIRKLFRPLVLISYLCEKCGAKQDQARSRTEAKVRELMAKLPPHVKVEIVQPKPKKRPHERG